MAFWGDYHTHTTYSHGKGSVLDNARAAAEKGLKEIAVTDHGFRHVFFGIRRKKLPAFFDDCEKATLETGVRVLKGIENNLCSSEGLFDIDEETLCKLDVVQGGYHKSCLARSFGQEMSFQLKNLFRSFMSKSPAKLISKNTDAYLKLIDNYELDFIGHINRDIRADALTVARYAKEKGTYIELNCKRMTLTDAELEKMAEEGVMFICNSDAHRPEKVGDLSVALQTIERLHIPYELIANWERFPSFRSHCKRTENERAEGEEIPADAAEESDVD